MSFEIVIRIISSERSEKVLNDLSRQLSSQILWTRKRAAGRARHAVARRLGPRERSRDGSLFYFLFFRHATDQKTVWRWVSKMCVSRVSRGT